MKTLTLLSVMFFSLCTLSSFEKKDTQTITGTYTATVNGIPLGWDARLPYRGMLLTRQALINGRAASQTVININFNGPSYELNGGKRFSEKLEFFVVCNGECPSKTPEFSLHLLYNGGDYFAVKDVSGLNINNIYWHKDRSGFAISADFDVVMRSYGYPMDDKPDLKLKGSLDNIVITVPQWLAQKVQAAN